MHCAFYMYSYYAYKPFSRIYQLHVHVYAEKNAHYACFPLQNTLSHNFKHIQHVHVYIQAAILNLTSTSQTPQGIVFEVHVVVLSVYECGVQ